MPGTTTGGRARRPDPLKLLLLCLLAAPGALLAWRLGHGQLGARPLAAAIQSTGLWAMRWLVLSLAVSPLRRSLALPRLARLRRMIGVAAFAYAFAHLLLFALDHDLDLAAVAGEMLHRFYLTVGTAALAVLAALAATSTNAAMRRLGGRGWMALHRWAYAALLLAVLHDLLQARPGAAEPLATAGLAAWLLLHRLLAGRAGWPAGRTLLWLGAGMVALAAAVEALWLHLLTHAPLERILPANLSLAAGWRPAQLLLAVLGVLAAALLARRFG